MTDHSLSHSDSSAGEYAVDGLLNGLIAGVVMAAYLTVVTLIVGDDLTQLFQRFSFSGDSTVAGGIFLHLAVAGIYGLCYGLILRFLARMRLNRLPALVTGVVYGFGLWLVAQLVLLPGTDMPLAQLSSLHFAISHIFYGLTLGFMTHRRLSAR